MAITDVSTFAEMLQRAEAMTNGFSSRLEKIAKANDEFALRFHTAANALTVVIADLHRSEDEAKANYAEDMIPEIQQNIHDMFSLRGKMFAAEPYRRALALLATKDAEAKAKAEAEEAKAAQLAKINAEIVACWDEAHKHNQKLIDKQKEIDNLLANQKAEDRRNGVVTDLRNRILSTWLPDDDGYYVDIDEIADISREGLVTGTDGKRLPKSEITKEMRVAKIQQAIKGFMTRNYLHSLDLTEGNINRLCNETEKFLTDAVLAFRKEYYWRKTGQSKGEARPKFDRSWRQINKAFIPAAHDSKAEAPVDEDIPEPTPAQVAVAEAEQKMSEERALELAKMGFASEAEYTSWKAEDDAKRAARKNGKRH